jgi:hypothetical protein
LPLVYLRIAFQHFTANKFAAVKWRLPLGRHTICVGYCFPARIKSKPQK